ncbi:MAG TPA: isoprenyl transferase [Bacteroidia bacterium]|jgi:undecaprenyl diphosphate synthase|nr:isoprenyl transferase [Bacteroidia bacterium]
MTDIEIDKNRIPKHVAVIMDGNGRWAKQKGKNRIFGHTNGVKSVRETIEAAAEIGVKYLTMYAFSTENWNRPKDEVSGLMELLVLTINKEIKTLMENDIALQAIGDLKSLPSLCYKELMRAIEKTSKNKRMTLVLALSYSSKWEIINAVKRIAKEVEKGSISADNIDEEIFNQSLCTGSIPDPELLIRTSGEHRISNFLLWQIAYAELYFTDKLWPDFRKPDFYQAIADYQKRERRFGKTSEQLSNVTI